MTQTKTETTTLRLSRVIKAPAKRVYNAFIDADAMAKWLPPNGYTGRMDKMDARVGGKWHGSFTSLDKKESHSFGGEFLELKPHERIRYTDVFDSPDLPGTMVTTVTFKEVKGGTEVTVVQEGIPKVIPLEDAQTGWGQSFDNLARLVELPQ
jgi:uncharacterized protein YndB with AHSA1/START domain